MHSPRILFAALLGASAILSVPSAALADPPQVLGTFKNWSAYQTGTGSGKVCYALSRPTVSDPRKLKRDPAYFLINDWPGRKAKGEPEIVPGYQYKDGSDVTAEIGADKFSLFTKNDGGAGGAWVMAQADEERLITAMKGGAQVIVTGISKRGTMTHDTYSLVGLSEALDKIHQSCSM
ncbi:MAG TPA: invasion associated locus B family protein [Rhizomicrobium sp.]